jgi:hypothetical protein
MSAVLGLFFSLIADSLSAQSILTVAGGGTDDDVAALARR